MLQLFASAGVRGLAAASAILLGGSPACTGAAGRASDAAHRPAQSSADALLSAGRRPVVTGWEDAPQRLASARCGRCHREQHAQWRQSMHAQAWSDPLFARAFALEPRQWCRNCHLPLLAQQTGAVAASEGIGCAVCHVRDGMVIGARARADLPAHRVRAVVGFDGSELCAGCHQFAFPASWQDTVRYSQLPMQDTIAEWRAAKAPPCRDCHGGSHRVQGPHDQPWLAGLVRGAELEPVDDGVLGLRLQLNPRGHALPTGDQFHSLRLELATDAAFGDSLLTRRYGRELGRGFISPFRISTRATLRDASLPASEDGLQVSFDRPASARLFARLRYFMHDPVLDGASAPQAESAVTVWSAAFDLDREEQR